MEIEKPKDIEGHCEFRELVPSEGTVDRTFMDNDQHAQAKELHRVVRKLDWNLMPLLFLLYTCSVLDRSNLGNAKLAGLQEDLHLTGPQYQWLGTSFYIAYILFQFSTVGWKLFPAHIWVACAVLFWGTASTLQATATSWSGLMACRFFLGVAETMFGPGVPLYLSFFYPREKLGTRFGIFLSGSALANAYSSTLAYGISHIKCSVANWRLLFIVEGVPCVILAGISFFWIPDRPDTARFLTSREREIAASFARSQPGRDSVGNSTLNTSSLLASFYDYKNWAVAIMNFSCNVSFASLPLFLPTIIHELGAFDALTSNGLSAPPYLLCFFVILGVCFASDRLRLRGPFAAACAVIAASGYLILALTSTVAPRYAALFLTVLIFVTTALLLIWAANINESESKRAGGLVLLHTVGQCGTLLGTNLYPANEAPLYRKGMWIAFAFSLTAALTAIALSVCLYRENIHRDRLYGKRGSGSEIDASLPEEARFRYMI